MAVFGNPFGEIFDSNAPAFVTQGAPNGSQFSGDLSRFGASTNNSASAGSIQSAGQSSGGGLVNQTGLGQVSQNPFAIAAIPSTSRDSTFGQNNAFSPFAEVFDGDGSNGREGHEADDGSGFIGNAIDTNARDFASHAMMGLGMTTGLGAAQMLGKAGFEAVTGKPFGLSSLADALGFGTPDAFGHDADGTVDIGNDNTAQQNNDIANQVDTFSTLSTPPGFGVNAADMGEAEDEEADDDTSTPGDGSHDGMPGNQNAESGAMGDEGGSGSGECVIATHALAAGAFTRRDKANAVIWCRKHLHGSRLGEAFRRGYRWHGNRAIARGEADRHYGEFRQFVDCVTGKDRSAKACLSVAWRALQFTATGLFVRR